MYRYIYIFGNKFDAWNFCLGLSIFVVLFAVVLFRPKDFPLRRIQIFWAGVLFLFFGLFGAGLLNIFINISKHQGQTLEELFKTTGSAYLGGPILGFLFLWIFCRNTTTPFLLFSDYFAPFLMVERIIGRIGCLGYGCCYGITSNLPWAQPFYRLQLRHPTQAYEIIYVLAILVSSRYLYKRTKDTKGITFFYVIFMYSFFRFLNEFLRAEGPFVYGQIKLSHIALFIFAIISIIGLLFIIKKTPAKNEISKAIKGAITRMFVWIIAAGAIILLVLSFVPKQ